MGTMIPRLKSHRCCCLRISEIKSLFSEISQVRKVKSALPVQLCSGTFKENCLPIYKHVLTFAGHISKTDVTIPKKKCFSTAA